MSKKPTDPKSPYFERKKVVLAEDDGLDALGQPVRDPSKEPFASRYTDEQRNEVVSWLTLHPPSPETLAMVKEEDARTKDKIAATSDPFSLDFSKFQAPDLSNASAVATAVVISSAWEAMGDWAVQYHQEKTEFGARRWNPDARRALNADHARWEALIPAMTAKIKADHRRPERKAVSNHELAEAIANHEQTPTRERSIRRHLDALDKAKRPGWESLRPGKRR